MTSEEVMGTLHTLAAVGALIAEFQKVVLDLRGSEVAGNG